jgi:hypothetical protein
MICANIGILRQKTSTLPLKKYFSSQKGTFDRTYSGLQMVLDNFAPDAEKSIRSIGAKKIRIYENQTTK